MNLTPVARAALIIAAPLLLGGDRSSVSADAGTAIAAPITVATSATHATGAAFAPGATSLSGRVVRLDPNGVVIETAGREAEISLTSVIDVWKETSVPAGALEVGDDLFVNGVGGPPFAARYVYANIGRVDGVIRAIDQTGMLVDVQLRVGAVPTWIDFSRYVEYGAPAANIRLTRADLVVGRTIGAVVYRPRLGPLRATRIW